MKNYHNDYNSFHFLYHFLKYIHILALHSSGKIYRSNFIKQ